MSDPGCSNCQFCPVCGAELFDAYEALLQERDEAKWETARANEQLVYFAQKAEMLMLETFQLKAQIKELTNDDA